jgi:hypothetical protein
MTKQFESLWLKAQAAGAAAAKAENDRLPASENMRGLDCGFAWVVIKPARGGFVKFLKASGIGRVREYGGGGMEIWYSKLHGLMTQSVSVHYAAAKAAAEVLKEAGLHAYADQRLD